MRREPPEPRVAAVTADGKAPIRASIMGGEKLAESDVEERKSKRERRNRAFCEMPAEAGGCARGSLLFVAVLRGSLPIGCGAAPLTAAAAAAFNARQGGFLSPDCWRIHCPCS